jgi:hypothetical protein
VYVMKKNNVWWLRSFLTENKNKTLPKTENRNLGKNYKVARKIVIEELAKFKEGSGDWSTPEYKKNFLDRMDKIEKDNPSYITLKLSYRQYDKIKSHLPPELRNLTT